MELGTLPGAKHQAPIDQDLHPLAQLELAHRLGARHRREKDAEGFRRDVRVLRHQREGPEDLLHGVAVAQRDGAEARGDHAVPAATRRRATPQKSSSKIALDRRTLHRKPQKVPMSGLKLASPTKLGLALPRAPRGTRAPTSIIVCPGGSVEPGAVTPSHGRRRHSGAL